MTTTTTTTINPDSVTAIPCPSWCTVDHTDMPPGAGFHASDTIGPEIAASGRAPARLWQTDQPGSPAGIIIAGELLNADQTHGMGVALLRAAKVLEREAQS
jgi:hypothetical protein